MVDQPEGRARRLYLSQRFKDHRFHKYTLVFVIANPLGV
jgi:hypothetical protein